MLVAWEALAQSGLLYRDVVPSLGKIGASLFTLLVVYLVLPRRAEPVTAVPAA